MGLSPQTALLGLPQQELNKLTENLRFAADNTVFTTSFSRRGLIAEHGISWMLPRIVGQGRASELLYTGRSLGGEEGERWGFFNKLCEPERVVEEAQAMAKSLADGPTFAHGITKTQLHMEWSMSLEQAIEAHRYLDRREQFGKVVLTVAAAFVEVFLAKEGHDGAVGINLMRKIELPLPFAAYGAMLAGVDAVLVGAGNPADVPGLVRRLARGEDVAWSVRVQGATSADGDTAVSRMTYQSCLGQEAAWAGAALLGIGRDIHDHTGALTSWLRGKSRS